MYHFRVFFIITLLFSLGSCSAHRSFSKRKHLSGKFWNSSGSKRTTNNAKKTTVLKANDLFKKREAVLIEELKQASLALNTVDLDTLKLAPDSRIKPVGNDHDILSPLTTNEPNFRILEKEEAPTNKVVEEASHRLKKPNLIEVIVFIIFAALVLGILFAIAGITCILLAFLYGISNHIWLLAMGIIFIAIGAILLYFLFT